MSVKISLHVVIIKLELHVALLITLKVFEAIHTGLQIGVKLVARVRRS